MAKVHSVKCANPYCYKVLPSNPDMHYVTCVEGLHRHFCNSTCFFDYEEGMLYEREETVELEWSDCDVHAY